MKLRQENQELLNDLYPKGYEIKDAEKHNYHVLFVKIFKTGGRKNDVHGMVQQISVKDWEVQKRLLDKGWRLAAMTGYDEFEVIHDPTVKEVKSKPGPKPSKVEPQN